jgi:hypothetical protein
MDVFDMFDLSDYTFLRLSRGGVAGDSIISTHTAAGVFKLRTGMVVGANQETKSSESTLHVQPTESFITSTGADKDPERLVGHGIQCQGGDYEIVGATGGDNYETGEREHYRLTLKATDFSGLETVDAG